MNDNPTFILAGNGPYENRGCEAIVRGTVKILRQYYDNPSFVCVSLFQNKEQFEKQCQEEYDSAIIHKQVNKRQSKYDTRWLFRLPLRKIYPRAYKNWMYKEMLPYIAQSKAVLSIGGDNYSLDYGIPKPFTHLDDVVLERNRPLIIWGASVGPFTKNPEYEKYIVDHLKLVTGIFARESVTLEYLRVNRIEGNVFKVTDPAFLMDASEPQSDKKIKIEQNSIGVNLSPLMARYVSGGDEERWTKTATNILIEIAKNIDEHIYLIPHVTVSHSNDYLFLKKVQSNMKEYREKTTLIPPIYNASETKWIISKMKLFAGSRTHSTIAALSSGVPTLSFAYSSKAKGINKDVFGHDFYCLDSKEVNPENVTKKIKTIIGQNSEIKATLKETIPNIQKEALLAGKFLHEITG
ncbi:polysaccharide pyruvyl transferase family protein [Methanolobus halotolerans]|uniref:Polysaccharide pyruvyl transferase family protein n=1 Tax=Methanolobus halotolerans TaxID=2052935 RepID=A0A4E0PVE5_9EURY|nr:polysaccharide pyruvyl transferase family protein [Methanolobus halotolerans]TGC08028.1 polysaccharide pyruvyl transferase family protein [Methanolobus halotolerans]